MNAEGLFSLSSGDHSGLLSDRDFSKLIEIAPLIAIDLVIENCNHEFLLGRRVNEPARGSWFVPGGRIFKGERLRDAYDRILRGELGLTVGARPSFLGLYDHHYANSYVSPSVSTHYVVAAVKVRVGEDWPVPPAPQHDVWRWASVEDILADPDVHIYTKTYFDSADPASNRWEIDFATT